MRNGSANRRPRGRNNRSNNKGGGNNRAQVYDSNGPEVRIRGTAFQICEKYEALAKDARSVGDWVLAESYLQHAEHYQRIITEINAQNTVRQEQHSKAPQQEQKTAPAPEGNKASKEDLSLPSSILGGEVKVKEQPVRELAEA